MQNTKDLWLYRGSHRHQGAARAATAWSRRPSEAQSPSPPPAPAPAHPHANEKRKTAACVAACVVCVVCCVVCAVCLGLGGFPGGRGIRTGGKGGPRRTASRRVFLWASHVVGHDIDELWWPTDLVSGYKRGPECRKNSTCTYVEQPANANGPIRATSAPHMPGRCAGELPRGMTTADSISVGRFDQKLAAQRLFPSLSS
jgi:hypothetical protein